VAEVVAVRHKVVLLGGVDGTPIARAGVGVRIRNDHGAAASLEPLDQHGRFLNHGRLRRRLTVRSAIGRLCGRVAWKVAGRRSRRAGHGRVPSVVEVVAATLGQGRGPSTVPCRVTTQDIDDVLFSGLG